MLRDKKQSIPAQVLVYFHDAEMKGKTETKMFLEKHMWICMS